MFIRIKNENYSTWDYILDPQYGTDVVVSLIGNGAKHQFQQIPLTMEEIEATLPLTVFDDHSCEKDFHNILQIIKDAHISICSSDMLFVLSELETDKDVDNCLLCAEQLKSYNLTFFVTHEKNRRRSELSKISDKFKHVIYVSDGEVDLFSPVKQLICDYYRPSCIGIDVADVVYIFKTEHKLMSYFINKTFDNMDAMGDYIPELLEYIDARKTSTNPYPDFMFFLRVPQDTSLDKPDIFVSSVIENYNGYKNNIVWSFNFNSDPKDDTCTLLLQIVLPAENE